MKRATLVALASATAGLAGASVYGQTFTPIPLNSSSYNAAVIVPNTASQTGATSTITASMDSGTSQLNNNVWFEKGYDTALPADGVPVHNSTFTSLSGTALFTMPASYGNGSTPTNDALFTGATAGTAADTTPSATFQFATPGVFSGFSILTGTSSGPMTFSATVNYVNGNTQTITGLSSPDWFGSGTAAYYTNARCVPGLSGVATTYGVQTNNPTLWQVNITGITDTVDPISSVTVSTTSTGSRTSMFAISGTYVPMIYTGTDATNPGVFDTSTDQNFALNGTPTSFSTNDNVIFNDTATSAPNGGNVVVGAAGVSPSSVTFANNAIAYNLSGGSITGFGALYVNAGGTVTLSQLNSYTGQTNVSNGTLNVASTGSIGTGALYLGSTGTVNLNNLSQTITSLSGSGFLNLSGTNLNIGSGGTATTLIAGTGNITFNGSQTLTGANTYVGTTTFNGSSVTISSNTAFGPSSNPLNVSGGASTLTPSAAMTVAGSNPLAYNINISAGSALTLSAANALDFTGAITGPGLLVKTGAGTLNLINTGNAFGSLNVSTGTVEFASGTLGGPGNTVSLTGGVLLYAPGNTEDITTTHTLNLNSGGGTINTSTNSVTFAGTLNGTNLGQLVLLGPVTNPGVVTIQTAIKPTNSNFSGGSPTTPFLINFNGPSAAYSQTSTAAGLNIGQNTGDYVIFNVSNGAHFSILGGDANGGLNLADQANATSTDGYNATTGVINILGSSSLFYSTSELFIGKAGGAAATNVASGTVNLMGGTFNAPSVTLVTELGAASNGYGFLNISGGAAYLNLVQLGTTTNSFGTLNLSGGTLSAYNISGGAGTSKIYFNGGVLNANSNYSSSKSFISSMNSAQIQTGGLTITTYNVSNPSTPIQTNSSMLISANLSTGVTGSADGGLTFNSGTGSLTLSGNDSYTGPTILNGNLAFTQTGTTTLPGNITSPGTLTQSGTGTTILGGADAFPGGVFISAGVLQLQPGATLGAPAINLSGGALGISSDSALNGYTINNSGGAIQFNNYTSNLSFNNVGNLRLGAANGSASTLAGNITGATNLIYIGPGTLILAGSDTYTGYTNVSGGTLNFSANNLGTGPVTLNGGIIQYATGNTQDLTSTLGLTLAAGASGIDVGSNNVTFASNISGAALGSLAKYGVGTLTLDSYVNPTSLYVRAGTLALVGTTSNVSSSAAVAVGYSVGDSATLSMDQGATVKAVGDLDVAATATTAGVTTGVFNLADTTSLGTSLTAANVYVGNGSSGTTAANAVGTVNQTGGLLKLNSSTGNFYVGNYGAGTYNQSAGNVVAGAITLAKNNGSTGVYNLRGGNLTTTQILGGAGTSTVNFNGGTVIANASSTTFVTGLTTASIGAGGAIFNTNSYTLGIPQNFSSGVTAPATDGGLTKLGAGTLGLSGTSNYSGGTVVSAGRLNAYTSGALGTGPVSIGSGTTLSLGSNYSSFVLNGGATLSGSTFLMTTAVNSENRSVWAPQPVSVTNTAGFSASFIYQATGTADGVTFDLQDDPRGTAALGTGGGDLGYNGAAGTAISPSASIQINLYQTSNGSPNAGTVFETNGGLPPAYGNNSVLPVVLNSGDKILVTLAYNGSANTLQENLVDQSTAASYTITYTGVNFQTILGATTAYIGFTGSTGGYNAAQNVSNLSYNSGTGLAYVNVITVPAGATSTLEDAAFLNGNSVQAGGLIIGAAGTLDVVPAASLSPNSPYTVTMAGATNVSGEAVFDIAKNGTGIGTLSLGALNDGGSASTLVFQDGGTTTLAATATSLVNGTFVFVGSLGGGSTPGNLALNAPGALGTLAFVNDQTGSTVSLGASQTFGTITGGGNVVLNGNTLTIGSSNNLSNGFLGTISDGTSPGAVTIGGTGSFTLAGSDSYTGLTTINSGATLTLGSATALVSGNSVVANGTLNLNYSQTVGSLNGSGGVVLNGTTLTIGGSANLSSTFSGVISDGSASGSLTVAGTGPLSLYGVNTYTGLTTVNAGATLNVYGSLGSTGAVTTSGTVNFEANNSGGIYARTKGQLTINAGGVVTVGVAATSATRTFLTVSGLSIAGAAGAYTGVLDLANNDLDVQGGNLSTITSQIAQGYANGTWQGSGGIRSSVAAVDSTHLTALGVIENTIDGGTTQLYGATTPMGTFDGANPAATDILVKYTYYGDANLDGKVDGSDYSKIDAGYAAGGTLIGWANGDFNYDGVIDGSDYTLIDNAFNSQGVQITASIASPSAQVAGSSAVPEPATFSLLAIGVAGLLGRRRRPN